MDGWTQKGRSLNYLWPHTLTEQIKMIGWLSLLDGECKGQSWAGEKGSPGIGVNSLLEETW